MNEPPIAISLTAAAVAVVVVMTATAVISKRTGKAAYVDAAWGASFVGATWAAVATVLGHGASVSWRGWVLLVLVTLWGGRLTWHLSRRVGSCEHDDPRYESYLGGPIATVPFARVLVKVFALQALLVMVVCVPVVIGISGSHAQPTLVSAGVVVWLIGAAFESISDAQLARHRADPHRPPLLATGLWGLSRHPNYFGDFCVWWGFWLIGGAAGGLRDGLASVLSVALMSWILIGVSGVRLAEKRMRGRPGWTAYAARTPVFIPWRFGR